MLMYVKGMAVCNQKKGGKVIMREQKNQDIKLRDEIIKKYLGSSISDDKVVAAVT